MAALTWNYAADMNPDVISITFPMSLASSMHGMQHELECLLHEGDKALLMIQ